MSNDERLSAILGQPELEILRSLAELSAPDLHRLEQLEMKGEDRDNILDAIDRTLTAHSANA